MYVVELYHANEANYVFHKHMLVYMQLSRLGLDLNIFYYVWQCFKRTLFDRLMSLVQD